MNYMDNVTDYLGVAVLHKNDGLYLHQIRYIDELLDRHGMADCKPVLIPMDPNHHLLPANKDYRASEDDKKEYRQLLGGCQWLASTTRPDISFATSTLAQFSANPDNDH